MPNLGTDIVPNIGTLQVLPNVTEVKDLGIIVDHELKIKRHIIQDITTRAHQRASLILRCFKSKDPFFAVQGICDLRATTPGV